MRARGFGGLLAIVAACASQPGAPSATALETPGQAPASVDPLDAPTPMDAAVKKGTLPNGLTYYVRRHARPEQRASLWLAVNAGSVLEDDDQRGVAHFVEHMAFNGTTRFPKQSIFDFIERAGMTLGPDLNATTEPDQTVYRFTVPTDHEPTLQQGLDVLRDIAGSVSFDPTEVELERPVILEEWRIRRGAGRRLAEKRAPLVFQGSRYAERIGIVPERIRDATVQTLRRFYEDWYRPDQMALIAVGDFEPAQMEREIRRRFSDLRASQKPRARPVFAVPRTHAPAVSVMSDPELRSSYVDVFDKVEPMPKRSRRDFRNHLVDSLYLELVSGRLSEIRDDPREPFVSTTVERLHLSRTLDAIAYSTRAKEGRIEQALQVLFNEIERTRRFGFSAAEIERAKKRLIVKRETFLSEADKAPASSLAAELVRNFFEAEQVPGAELELAWVHEFVPGITPTELHVLAAARSAELGRVISVSTPASVAAPSTARVQEIVASARTAKLASRSEKPFDEPLITTPPTPGNVVSDARDAAADASVWTLSNGIRVIVKPTTFRNESVVLRGFQAGGTSLVSDPDFVHARFADEIVAGGGAGKFSARDLSRLLSGKRVSVSLDLGELGQTVQASARASDLATMFELLYLRLTAPRTHRFAFDVWKGRGLDAARHRADSPDQAFQDELAVLLAKNHLRRRPPSIEMIESVDMEKALALFRERFADLGGFTFVIVGNFDVARLKPLVETYLGSLPSKPPHAHWKDPKIPYPTGKVEKTIVLGAEPKSRVKLVFTGPIAFSDDARRDAAILEELLEIRLVEVLRERLGGTYSVSVNATLQREPTTRRSLEVAFGCAPENVQKLTAVVFDELRAIAANGIDEAYLAKVRLRLERRRAVNVTENGWWARVLLDKYRHGDDFGTSSDLAALVRRATRENVKAIAARMFDPENYVLAVLRPASKAAPGATAKPGVPEAEETLP